MPREKVAVVRWRIYDKDGRNVNSGVGEPSEVPEGGHISYSPGVELHWSREYGNVQLSVEFPAEQWIVNAEQLKEDPDIKMRGIFTDGLSRREINDLIRTLRRARDAAYGKDE